MVPPEFVERHIDVNLVFAISGEPGFLMQLIVAFSVAAPGGYSDNVRFCSHHPQTLSTGLLPTLSPSMHKLCYWAAL